MNDLSTGSFLPPETQKMNKIVKWGALGAMGLGGVYAFTAIAHPVITAITLLNTILQDTTSMAISGGVLLGTLLILNETFSSTGKINQFIRLPYWMLIRWATRQCMTIDPFASIDQRINQGIADMETYDAQVQKVSGIIGQLRDQEDNCRQQSAAAQKLGVAAHNKGMKDAEDLQSSAYGQYKETADTLAAMRSKLEPLLTTFQRIYQACQNTTNKLKIERHTLQIKWNAQQAISGVVSTANRILGRSNTQVWNMAEQASEIINTKYGDELGRLDHLKLVTEPLMDTIDLQNATYNDDMLKAVNASAVQLIAVSDKTPAPVTVAAQ